MKPTLHPQEPFRTGGVPGLRQIARLAHETGLSALATEAERSAERITGGRFYVACVGQFKRGKSTLLNALIGELILPTGVVPVTSVVTVLRYGAGRSTRVCFTNGEQRVIPPEFLAAYVSEDQNPENKKEVEAVEVFVPAKLLESGMCLVDTPGLGSVFAGGSRSTRAFVPQIDVALVVLGADPPISGEELALVEEVSSRIQTLIVLLNKADRLSEAERHEAARFTARVLEDRLGRSLEPILQVSATERLAGHGPKRDWDLLVGRLTDLARHAGAGLVKSAEERAQGLLASRLIRGVDEQLSALRRPIEETERRLEALRASTGELERALEELRYLLTAQQDRVSQSLTQERARFLPRALGEARLELEAAGRALREKPAAEAHEASMEAARNIATRHLDRWLEEQQPLAERHYRDVGQRFVDLTNGFLARFEAAREFGLDQLPPALAAESGFRVSGHLYYTELLHLTTSWGLPWLLDRLSPRSRALKRATGYLERLLTSNSSRIQNNLIERVAESRRQLEAEIRSRLMEALEAAERALERARKRHTEGQEAVRSEVERLEALKSDAEELAKSH
jgi:GTP-binding protein EngB required for normal cell division